MVCPNTWKLHEIQVSMSTNAVALDSGQPVATPAPHEARQLPETIWPVEPASRVSGRRGSIIQPVTFREWRGHTLLKIVHCLCENQVELRVVYRAQQPSGPWWRVCGICAQELISQVSREAVVGWGGAGAGDGEGSCFPEVWKSNVPAPSLHTPNFPRSPSCAQMHCRSRGREAQKDVLPTPFDHTPLSILFSLADSLVQTLVSRA